MREQARNILDLSCKQFQKKEGLLYNMAAGRPWGVAFKFI
jgi:hypothetical protein